MKYALEHFTARLKRFLLIGVVTILAPSVGGAITWNVINPSFTYTSIINFPTTPFLGAGPSDAVMRPDGTLLVPLQPGAGSAGLHAFTAAELASGPFPIDATGHELAASSGQNYHALAYGPTGRLFATVSPGSLVVEVNPLTGAVIQTIADLSSFGVSPIDGLTFNSHPNFYALVAGGVGPGIYKIDVATSAVTQLTVAGLGAGVDHLSWDDSLKVLHIAGRFDDLVQYDRVTGLTCSSGPTGFGVDGIAVGNTNFPKPMSALQLPNNPVFFNCNDGTLRAIDALPGTGCYGGSGIQAGGVGRNDGVGAPGDGHLYITHSGEVLRATVVDPPFVPFFLESGSSPQVNLYMALSALKADGSIRPEGLADALLRRMSNVLEFMRQGELARAKHLLETEIQAGIRGLQQEQISSPAVRTVLLDLLQGVVAGLP